VQNGAHSFEPSSRLNGLRWFDARRARASGVILGTGLLLGLYAAVILPWSASTLGRFLVPQARVSSDHELVVEGPFQFVRHPAYSGDLALWLGSALATANLLLLLLWPLYVLGATLQSRAEDDLLASKFGDDYRRYAARVGRFVPRLAY